MDMDQVATVKPGLGRVGLQDLDWNCNLQSHRPNCQQSNTLQFCISFGPTSIKKSYISICGKESAKYNVVCG